MPNLSNIAGKNLALVLYSKGKRGKEEGAVFFGKARIDGEALFLDREDAFSFEIPKGVLDRLQPVNEDIKDVLNNAEYWIWLTVGDLPKGEDLSKYQPTHLKWPT